MDDLSTRFESVFEEHCDYVVRSLLRLGVRPRDAADVAQEVFLAVHDRLDSYDPARPIRPWLFAFAFRRAGNYRRLARNRREDVGDDHIDVVEASPGAVSTPEEALIEAERRALLHQALETLDLEHRASVVMVDIDGVSARDAAEALGIPLNTVYSRVRNGRRKLRDAVQALATRRLEEEP